MDLLLNYSRVLNFMTEIHDVKIFIFYFILFIFIFLLVSLLIYLLIYENLFQGGWDKQLVILHCPNERVTRT